MSSAPLNMQYMIPELLLFILACGILIADMFLKGRDKKYLWDISFAGLIVILIALLNPFLTGQFPGKEMAFGGQAYADNLTLLLRILIISSLFAALIFSVFHIGIKPGKTGVFIFLTMISALGALVMSSAGDLIVLLIGLEIMSLPLYVLAGFQREKAEAREAGFKYFILGSFASAFLALGIMFVFGICQETGLKAIREIGATGVWLDSVPLRIGVVLIISTLAFKGGLMPFYAWLPDVYRGSPDYIVGFMAALAKIAVYGTMIRLALVFIPAIGGSLIFALAFLYVLTVVLGNLMALWQSDVKRMLAYSSIAHAGYLLLGILANRDTGFSAIIFYLLVYAFTIMGSFAIAGLVSYLRGGYQLSNFDGLYRDHPLLAFFMTVFMFTLAGIPPLAGFWGKFFLFNSAVDAGLENLAIIGGLASLLGVYYYLRVIVRMYMNEIPEGVEVKSFPLDAMTKWGLRLATALVIFLGFFPGLFHNAVSNLIRWII